MIVGLRAQPELFVCLAKRCGRAREGFEERLQFREPAPIGIGLGSGEPGLDFGCHQKLTMARSVTGIVKNRCSMGRLSRFHANFTASWRPNGPELRPPPPSAK